MKTCVILLFWVLEYCGHPDAYSSFPQLRYLILMPFILACPVKSHLHLLSLLHSLAFLDYLILTWAQTSFNYFNGGVFVIILQSL